MSCQRKIGFLLLVFWNLPSLGESFQAGTRLEISDQGAALSVPGLNSPVNVDFSDKGAQLNFSIFGRGNPRGSEAFSGGASSPPSTIIRPVQPSSLMDSDEFFKNIGK